MNQWQDDLPADLFKGPEREILDRFCENRPLLKLAVIHAEILAAFIGSLPDKESTEA